MTKIRNQKQRAVLILGLRHVGEQIAEGLETQGFRTVLEEDLGVRFPLLGDPLYREKIRDALGLFAQWLERRKIPVGFVHPGVSVWAESAEFSILTQESGFTLIAPPSPVLALYSNKLNLFNEAEKVGIPNLVLASDPMHSGREIERLMLQCRHQFPVVLKSIRGSGSFGVFVAYHQEELGNKLRLWIEQLRRRTGEVILVTERYLLDARHVVVPFVRTIGGEIKVFPVVDASLQSNFRKVIQVAPALSVDAHVIEKVRGWTKKFAEHSRFVGVGSLEFLIEDEKAYLVDGSARLNSAFRLWETLAGTSAVLWQLWALDPRLLEGQPCCKPDPGIKVAMALRIFAEDSLLLLPQPGTVRELSHRRNWDAGRLFLGIKEAFRITYSHSGVLGDLFAFGDSYERVVSQAGKMLDELWIAGSLQTNERFLRELLDHPWVKEGIFCSGFVDEEFTPSVRPDSQVYRILGSVCCLIPEVSLLSDAGVRWAVGDQWVVPDPKSLIWKEGPFIWEGGVAGEVILKDGSLLRLSACPLSPLPEGRWMLRAGNWFFVVRRVIGVKQNKGMEKNRRKPRVLALVSGSVHSILFREGTTVPAHEPFLIIESLGKLIPHSAPLDFFVSRWKVSAEDEVTVGDDLADVRLCAGADGGFENNGNGLV